MQQYGPGSEMCVQLLRSAGAILLQREIPEAVNLEVAKVCLLPIISHNAGATCHSAYSHLGLDAFAMWLPCLLYTAHSSRRLALTAIACCLPAKHMAWGACRLQDMLSSSCHGQEALACLPEVDVCFCSFLVLQAGPPAVCQRLS